MKKNLSNHYIDRKHKFVYNKGDSRWDKITLENNCLFSDKRTGTYKTKITPDDLPEWYLNYWDGIRQNYINTKGVVDLIYRPVLENHIFKDDALYISYNGKIKELSRVTHISTWITFDENTYDDVIFGNYIIDFLVYAKVFSGYDIEPIKEKIWNDKMLWLKENETEMFEAYVKSRENFNSWFDKVEEKISKK